MSGLSFDGLEVGKMDIECPGKPSDAVRGAEHKWSESSMFHVRDVFSL